MMTATGMTGVDVRCHALLDAIERGQHDMGPQMAADAPPANVQEIAWVQHAYRELTGTSLTVDWLEQVLAPAPPQDLAGHPPLPAVPYRLADTAALTRRRRWYRWLPVGAVGLGLSSIFGFIHWMNTYIFEKLARLDTSAATAAGAHGGTLAGWKAVDPVAYGVWHVQNTSLNQQMGLGLVALMLAGVAMILVVVWLSFHHAALKVARVSPADLVVWEGSPAARTYLAERHRQFPLLAFEVQYLHQLADGDGMYKAQQQIGAVDVPSLA